MEALKISHITRQDIEELIASRREEYLRTPLRIVEDYNNENKNIEEYNGRQLLEMIQNANDESDTLKAKKVYIKLEEDNLLIANNGNAFSLGGVESLVYSDLSPKTMEKNKVGKKGLGFRSILNWSKEIYIASYNLHLKFSKKHAEDFLANILEEKPQIRQTLERKTKKKIPISVLRCPYLETDISKKKAPEYDTVIELLLKDDDSIFRSINKQIEKDITPETLIFLNKLEEIEIQTPNSHFQLTKTTNIATGIVSITRTDYLKPDNNQEWEWKILEDKGVLEGIEETKHYELKIAYNPEEELSFNKLFSFFRTEVDFPYPVIAHGSFELKSDRNNLSQDRNNFNTQLIEKLAKLLVECAIELTKSDKSNYDALKLLIPSGNQNSSLFEDPWLFDDLIKEYINETPIFPTINDTYITLENDFKFYEEPIDFLIPETHYTNFATLLKSTTDKDIIDYFNDEYEGFKYKDEEFTEKLNLIIDNSHFTIEEKVKWIDKLSLNVKKFYEGDKPVLPNLLVNHKERIIRTGKDEIILPPKGSVYHLPDELELQFVDRAFTEKLKEQISGDIRDLSIRLRVFGVDEYSMTVVARKVISASHQRLEKTEDKFTIVSAMHSVLFHIYEGMKEEEKKTFFQNLPSPLLFTQNDKLEPANKLYFSQAYDIGFLCSHLLKSITKDIFIGSSKANGLDSLVENTQQIKLEKYLKWIGVADMPRRNFYVNDDIPNKAEYVSHIFDGLTYPYSLPDDPKTFDTRQEINQTYSHEIEVLWFDFLEEILANASIEHIITWFIRDREINNCIVLDNEHDKAEFYFLFGSVRNYRYLEDNDVRSYLLYRLHNSDFIPIEAGRKAKPTECVSNSGNLAPLVHTPQINYDSDIFNRYNIKEDQISLLLNRLGVKDSFRDLSLSVMYNLLNEHQKYFDKNGRSATTLYSAIIDATTNYSKDFDWDIEERKKYLKTGFVLCSSDGENKYISVNDATYVLNPNHSQDLLAKLNVAKIRQRVGNNRIKELFGVEPMDYIEFKVKKAESNPEMNAAFQSELSQLKPLLFIYRYQKNLTETQKKKELSSLKQLKIQICYTTDVEFTLNGNTQPLELKSNEYVFEKKSQTYFIQIDNNQASYNSLKQDYRFTETLSDIICGSITVTENRKDFMLIISQHKSKWKEIMTREFPDFANIESEVMKNFDGVLTSKQLFWKSILKALGTLSDGNNLNDEKLIYQNLKSMINWDDYFDIYRGLNYLEPSNQDNFELIKELFASLKIDIKDFNMYSKDKLDFEVYYFKTLKQLHHDYLKVYKSILFSKGYSESFISEIESFENYDLKQISIPNSLFINLQKLYTEILTRTYGDLNLYEKQTKTIFDVEDVFRKNLKKLKKKLQSENILDKKLLLSLQYEQVFCNNLYFWKISDLMKSYKTNYLNSDAKRRTVKLTTKGEEIDITDDDKLLKQIEANIKNIGLKIELYKPKKGELSKTKRKSKSPKQSKNGLNSSGISKSDIGFIGEKYAYELLRKQFDEVIWKSEYAIRAGFSGGKDGYGYDFECRKGDDLRYIEVKATTTSANNFYVSKNEVQIGHTHVNNYDILLISNLLTENIKVKYLKNIFNYEKEDSFFDNPSFLVETDGYKIKFK